MVYTDSIYTALDMDPDDFVHGSQSHPGGALSFVGGTFGDESQGLQPLLDHVDTFQDINMAAESDAYDAGAEPLSNTTINFQMALDPRSPRTVQPFGNRPSTTDPQVYGSQRDYTTSDGSTPAPMRHGTGGMPRSDTLSDNGVALNTSLDAYEEEPRGPYPTRIGQSMLPPTRPRLSQLDTQGTPGRIYHSTFSTPNTDTSSFSGLFTSATVSQRSVFNFTPSTELSMEAQPLFRGGEIRRGSYAARGRSNHHTRSSLYANDRRRSVASAQPGREIDVVSHRTQGHSFSQTALHTPTIDVEPLLQTSRFYCEYCMASFSIRSALTRHSRRTCMFTADRLDRPICRETIHGVPVECPETFSRHDARTTHLTKSEEGRQCQLAKQKMLTVRNILREYTLLGSSCTEDTDVDVAYAVLRKIQGHNDSTLEPSSISSADAFHAEVDAVYQAWEESLQVQRNVVQYLWDQNRRQHERISELEGQNNSLRQQANLEQRPWNNFLSDSVDAEDWLDS